MRIAVLGAVHAHDALPDADEIVVIDPDADALLRLLREVGDPRFSYLLGELPVLPLPDAWVDAIVGADGEDPELCRISR